MRRPPTSSPAISRVDLGNKRQRGLLLVACGVMFVWLLLDAGSGQHYGERLVIVLAAGVTFLAALVFLDVMPAWGVLAYCVAASLTVRAVVASVAGSDVLAATGEAIQVTLHHQNPYMHYYASTRPPGQPFPYLPGAIVFYWLEQFVTHSPPTDRWSGMGTVVALALLAPVCGCARTAVAVAFFGVCPLSVVFSVDGSNETTLTFLSVAALVFLAHAERAGGVARMWLCTGCAVAFGWATAFKEFSWVLFPFVIQCAAANARRSIVAISLGVAAILIIPAFLANPAAFVGSLLGGITSHPTVWGFNIWAAHGLSPGSGFSVAGARALAAAIAPLAAVAFWVRKCHTLTDAIVALILVLTVAFLLVPWSSEAYYTYTFGLAVVAFVVFRPTGR
ncbi:MAG: hypothetical protein WCD03_07180 [Candidatus Cybelea sp.]